MGFYCSIIVCGVGDLKLKYKQAFMRMALEFAKTSEAKRLKVGGTIVQDGRITSLAINSTPTGWDTNDCEDENRGFYGVSL